MVKPFLAANWKMNHTRASAMEFARALKEGLGDRAERADVAVFPPYPFLAELSGALEDSKAAVGAQEMHAADSGAYTGAVSASMILDAGATMVLVGHSERRQIFGETDEGANEKMKKALAAGLKPILCIGETLEQREAGETEKVVLTQLGGGLDGVEDPAMLVLAYEPVWAIGTGKTATPKQAQEVHALIRGWLAERYGNPGRSVQILYGGSVKPGNVKELMAGEDVCGGLIGGASLEAGSFLDIIRNALD
ncbi:MAG: triose-phosphate isomerase [Planctomycetota bacterium]|jgi:triosephosphate isomerase